MVVARDILTIRIVSTHASCRGPSQFRRYRGQCALSSRKYKILEYVETGETKLSPSPGSTLDILKLNEITWHARRLLLSKSSSIQSLLQLLSVSVCL